MPVSDNGSAKSSGRAGHGLRIINELVTSLGGTFEQAFGPYGSISIVQLPV
jgi:glucose-6-phosphate-specific signal transduction histidine kinase